MPAAAAPPPTGAPADEEPVIVSISFLLVMKLHRDCTGNAKGKDCLQLQTRVLRRRYQAEGHSRS